MTNVTDLSTQNLNPSCVRTEIDNLSKIPKAYRHQINTFMKRRTHLSQKAQTALLSDTYHNYLVNPTGTIGKIGDIYTITDLRALFSKGETTPLTLEIGFGMGDSLIQMAQAFAHINFVGIEVHEPGIGRCAHLAHEANLNNLKLINGDAIALLQNLPADHIDTIQLYFPDPWQKKRHYKRRFVTPDRMQIVANTLKPNGIFHTATDWEHYAYWMLEVLDNMPQFQNTSGLGNFAPRPPHRPLTKFENRGITQGHGVWDLLYQKVG